jgi:hypothetical protein
VDLNKFKLENNVYNYNFMGMNSGIVYTHTVLSVHTQNETYSNNQGHYLEAHSFLSTIPVQETDDYTQKGAIEFSEYYTWQVFFDELPPADRCLYYPGSPLVIDGAIYLNMNTMNFDNNFKQEIDVFGFQNQVEQSE